MTEAQAHTEAGSGSSGSRETKPPSDAPADREAPPSQSEEGAASNAPAQEGNAPAQEGNDSPAEGSDSPAEGSEAGRAGPGRRLPDISDIIGLEDRAAGIGKTSDASPQAPASPPQQPTSQAPASPQAPGSPQAPASPPQQPTPQAGTPPFDPNTTVDVSAPPPPPGEGLGIEQLPESAGAKPTERPVGDATVAAPSQGATAPPDQQPPPAGGPAGGGPASGARPTDATVQVPQPPGSAPAPPPPPADATFQAPQPPGSAPAPPPPPADSTVQLPQPPGSAPAPPPPPADATFQAPQPPGPPPSADATVQVPQPPGSAPAPTTPPADATVQVPQPPGSAPAPTTPPADPTVQVPQPPGSAPAPTTPAAASVTGEIGAPAARPAGPAPTGDYATPSTAGVPDAANLSIDPSPTGTVPSVAYATATAAAAKSARPKRHVVRNSLVVAFGLLVLFVAAWALDEVRTDGEVARGTFLGTTPIGGLDGERLDDVLAQLDNELAMTSLQVNVEGDSVNTDPGTLGAELDRDLLHQRAMDARRDSFFALRPFVWATTFFTEEQLELRYTVDRAKTGEAIEAVLADIVDEPQEPELVLTADDVTIAPGQIGSELSIDEIAEELPQVLQAGAPFEIDLEASPASPILSDEEVQAVADEVAAATEPGLEIQVLDDAVQLEPGEIRQWVYLDTSAETVGWEVDYDMALADLRDRFPRLGSEDQQAQFSIVDGAPIIVPASETVICCTPESVQMIRDGLLQPAPPPPAVEEGESEPEPELRVVTLEPEVVGPDEGVAELEALGIIEEVSSFTTEHACCQNRVTNIHRFADIVRGAIIRPGEDLSLNGYVGRRTTENGFVADGAIVNGVLEPQVGGGVSQFATTFFNAAFFAGLEFNEYQSHSLYISRYPRGREATISFPRPDLSVKNTTDYGILVWPTYTDTSITVTFYSTKHIDVQALDLVQTSQGQCSVFTTPRIRTYPDGSVEEDSVFALYRPAEGLDCNGNSTVPE